MAYIHPVRVPGAEPARTTDPEILALLARAAEAGVSPLQVETWAVSESSTLARDLLQHVTTLEQAKEKGLRHQRQMKAMEDNERKQREQAEAEEKRLAGLPPTPVADLYKPSHVTIRYRLRSAGPHAEFQEATLPREQYEKDWSVGRKLAEFEFGTK
jgi:cellulose biosynthesis protein BcsQ